MIFKWKKIAVSPEAPNGWEEYHTEAALGDVVVTGKVFRDSESTLQWRGVVSDSDGSRKALGYYVSACLGCRDGDFPNVETYIACLSDNFLNGILTEARIHGELPEYNQKLAKKYNISPGNSYC